MNNTIKTLSCDAKSKAGYLDIIPIALVADFLPLANIKICRFFVECKL